MIADATHRDVLAKGSTALYADLAEFFLAHLPPATIPAYTSQTASRRPAAR